MNLQRRYRSSIPTPECDGFDAGLNGREHPRSDGDPAAWFAAWKRGKEQRIARLFAGQMLPREDRADEIQVYAAGAAVRQERATCITSTVPSAAPRSAAPQRRDAARDVSSGSKSCGQTKCA